MRFFLRDAAGSWEVVAIVRFDGSKLAFNSTGNLSLCACFVSLRLVVGLDVNRLFSVQSISINTLLFERATIAAHLGRRKHSLTGHYFEPVYEPPAGLSNLCKFKDSRPWSAFRTLRRSRIPVGFLSGYVILAWGRPPL